MIVHLLFIWMSLWDASSSEVPRSSGPLSEVIAIEGGRAMLPCNITPPTEGDSPILVLFYNGVTGMPVYSIDARSGPLQTSVHWSELGTRARFIMESSPQGLRLEHVEAADDGDYRCRVDFGASPTRNLRVKLMVVVPPKRISITNQSGLELSGIIGPYPVRGTLTLTCQTVGGKPKPQITWWHGPSLLDDLMDYDDEREVVANRLTLPNLSRQHLFRVLTCNASNSNMSQPLSASVTLDMKFPPAEVRIQESTSALSEGEKYKMVCEAMGSRPAATLTWYLDGILLPDSRDQILHDGNMTRSVVYIEPTREDNGAILSCRADNRQMEGAAVEDSRKLNVHYSPKLQLRAGHNLDITNIKEGDDVYFECDIQANPSVSRVQWFLGGEELVHNVVAGVIQSNQSLVLQRVTRNSTGFYTCRGTNIRGSATSNALQLKVKFSPVCAEGQKKVYGGGRRQAVNVSCEVEGHPPATVFKWAFNTSSEYMDIPPDLVHPSVGNSVVTYTPHTHHDFGSLLCWGINDVNTQQQPCVFHVVPAAPPEPVNNCTAWHNASAAGEVVVACQAGWSGGLSQTFTLEVREGPSTNAENTGTVLAALTDQPEPHFTVTGLAPGAEYELAIKASNAQGVAPATRIVYLTPIDVAEKRTSAAAADTESPFRNLVMTPLLAGLTGVIVSVLLLCTIVVVVVIKARSAQARPQTQTKILYDKASPSATGCDEGGFIQQQTQAKDPQPDIIRVKTEPMEAASDIQMNPECSLPMDESYCDSSSSLLNNGGLLPCETDSLLQGQAKEPTSRYAATPSATSSAPFHTGSLGRKSYSSMGHETPTVSYAEPNYSSLRRQKGFHSQDSDCDSAQIPLVMSSQSGTRESCV